MCISDKGNLLMTRWFSVRAGNILVVAFGMVVGASLLFTVVSPILKNMCILYIL